MTIRISESEARVLACIGEQRAPTKRRCPKEAKRILHQKVANQLIGLPKPTTEVYFHPTRKWRIDYAWTDLKIALEIHGGHRTGGRHVRGTGYAQDREKMNEAQLLGWIVIEATSDNLGQLRGWIERAMEMRK